MSEGKATKYQAGVHASLVGSGGAISDPPDEIEAARAAVAALAGGQNLLPQPCGRARSHRRIIRRRSRVLLHSR
jgi:hypothetical protein